MHDRPWIPAKSHSQRKSYIPQPSTITSTNRKVVPIFPVKIAEKSGLPYSGNSDKKEIQEQAILSLPLEESHLHSNTVYSKGKKSEGTSKGKRERNKTKSPAIL